MTAGVFILLLFLAAANLTLGFLAAVYCGRVRLELAWVVWEWPRIELGFGAGREAAQPAPHESLTERGFEPSSPQPDAWRNDSFAEESQTDDWPSVASVQSRELQETSTSTRTAFSAAENAASELAAAKFLNSKTLAPAAKSAREEGASVGATSAVAPGPLNALGQFQLPLPSPEQCPAADSEIANYDDFPEPIADRGEFAGEPSSDAAEIAGYESILDQLVAEHLPALEDAFARIDSAPASIGRTPPLESAEYDDEPVRSRSSV